MPTRSTVSQSFSSLPTRSPSPRGPWRPRRGEGFGSWEGRDCRGWEPGWGFTSRDVLRGKSPGTVVRAGPGDRSGFRRIAVVARAAFRRAHPVGRRVERAHVGGPGPDVGGRFVHHTTSGSRSCHRAGIGGLHRPGRLRRHGTPGRNLGGVGGVGGAGRGGVGCVSFGVVRSPDGEGLPTPLGAPSYHSGGRTRPVLRPDPVAEPASVCGPPGLVEAVGGEPARPAQSAGPHRRRPSGTNRLDDPKSGDRKCFGDCNFGGLP